MTINDTGRSRLDPAIVTVYYWTFLEARPATHGASHSSDPAQHRHACEIAIELSAVVGDASPHARPPPRNRLRPMIRRSHRSALSLAGLLEIS